MLFLRRNQEVDLLKQELKPFPESEFLSKDADFFLKTCFLSGASFTFFL